MLVYLCEMNKSYFDFFNVTDIRDSCGLMVRQSDL